MKAYKYDQKMLIEFANNKLEKYKPRFKGIKFATMVIKYEVFKANSHV